ncbi:hypothetical protein ABZX98_04010 [Streptomyces sp. NPDC002992]|uniref:hypothetical protein n=1 Tax=Streptomyces sp. NPDC002992 TaxID=3154273 RepID=UPI0033BCAAAB
MNMPPPPPGFGPPIPVPQPAHVEGPEFVAHDRRNSVIVDATGVSLEINGWTMDLPWAGVATVHFAPAPHGHVLMVAVRHPGGMLYECQVVARRRAQLDQWLAELGSVLPSYLGNRPPV